jgi:hypothetical protein
MIYYLFLSMANKNVNFFDQVGSGSVINGPHQIGSARNSGYESEDPDQKQKFTDPQHCFNRSIVKKNANSQTGGSLT